MRNWLRRLSRAEVLVAEGVLLNIVDEGAEGPPKPDLAGAAFPNRPVDVEGAAVLDAKRPDVEEKAVEVLEGLLADAKRPLVAGGTAVELMGVRAGAKKLGGAMFEGF